MKLRCNRPSYFATTVLILGLSQAGCKPKNLNGGSATKSLEHLTGSIEPMAACENKASTYTVNPKDIQVSEALRPELMMTLSAVPDNLKKKFFEESGRIEVTKDIAQKCPSNKPNVGNSANAACWNVVNGAPVIYMAEDRSAIRYSLLRMFGYWITDSMMIDPVVSLGARQVGQALMTDIVREPSMSLAVLQPYFVENAALLNENMPNSQRFIAMNNLTGMAAFAREVYYSTAFADAFHTRYCNSGSAASMLPTGKFRATGTAFKQVAKALRIKLGLAGGGTATSFGLAGPLGRLFNRVPPTSQNLNYAPNVPVAPSSGVQSRTNATASAQGQQPGVLYSNSSGQNYYISATDGRRYQQSADGIYRVAPAASVTPNATSATPTGAVPATPSSSTPGAITMVTPTAPSSPSTPSSSAAGVISMVTPTAPTAALPYGVTMTSPTPVSAIPSTTILQAGKQTWSGNYVDGTDLWRGKQSGPTGATTGDFAVQNGVWTCVANCSHQNFDGTSYTGHYTNIGADGRPQGFTETLPDGEVRQWVNRNGEWSVEWENSTPQPNTSSTNAGTGGTTPPTIIPGVNDDDGNNPDPFGGWQPAQNTGATQPEYSTPGERDADGNFPDSYGNWPEPAAQRTQETDPLPGDRDADGNFPDSYGGGGN